MMKKLLLLLLGFGLMMGVWSAANYEFIQWTYLSSDVWANAQWSYFVCYQDDCYLTSVLAASQITCSWWALVNTTWLILKTWMLNWNMAEVNYALWKNIEYWFFMYSGVLGSSYEACQHWKSSSSSLTKVFTGFSIWNHQFSYPKSNWNNTVLPITYYVSWTIYWPPTPPTIHYNNTTLSFAGTDIRLQGNFRYSLSGAADAIFRSSPFRSLLRRK